MKRTLGFLTLSFLMLVITCQTFVRGQDKVERVDKKGKAVFVSGKILEETSSGVKIKTQGTNKEEVIPANEITKVSYADLPTKAQIELGKVADAETARDYPKVLKTYEAIQTLPEAKASSATSRRYIDYRVASLRAMLADNDEQLKAAMKGLGDFIAANGDSWEYPHAARQLGRLQADTGDYAAATSTFEKLKKATVPAEFQQDATAALLDIAFQSENYDDGRKRVAEVTGDAKAPQALKDRVAVYQLGLEGAAAKDDAALQATIKKLEDVIAKSSDPSIRGLAYNVLGDCYSAKGKKRDAMWSYLWVDVVYNQDRGEHVKAMSRLIKIFEDASSPMKDDEKAKLYKEKLARSR